MLRLGLYALNGTSMAARPAAAGQVDERDGSLPAGHDKAVAGALQLRNPRAEFNGGLRCAHRVPVGMPAQWRQPSTTCACVVEQHG
ncbi:hypothetical protein ACRAWF_08935 [Streptomyces sp. L7]